MHANLKPIPMSLNSTITHQSPMVGCFLAITAGAITLTDAKGVTVLNAMPVAAGSSTNFYMNMASGNVLNGGTATLTIGASGTLLVR